jgi:hypothetical protein
MVEALNVEGGEADDRAEQDDRAEDQRLVACQPVFQLGADRKGSPEASPPPSAGSGPPLLSAAAGRS